ncbi:MAG: murein L,D-transpeptidase catalytic domain family protein [Alphaproteobacteria bacterium]|nr:murein L,D-transpeptidase catalytic domain family protein [Alphaproteobacteria bacterium]
MDARFLGLGLVASLVWACSPTGGSDADADDTGPAEGGALDTAAPDATDPTAPACPSGLTCVDTFPYVTSGLTTGATSSFDAYGCAPTIDESGPEVVYRVDLPARGFLAVELAPDLQPEGVDVDVHLLEALDPERCLDRGHHRAGALLEKGTYYVVVDSWTDEEGTSFDGAFELTIGLTRLRDLLALGIARTVAEDALQAFGVAWERGDPAHFAYAITDFSLHSSVRRMWILDLATGTQRWNLHVPHGQGSSDPQDAGRAVTFSNTPASHQSSLGVMRGAERYVGDYGESMRIDGLEPGFNDNVRDRAIVLHPWSGSRDTYVQAEGECDETWGCPALDDRLNEEVADFLAEGGLMIFHYPDPGWLEGSEYVGGG